MAFANVSELEKWNVVNFMIGVQRKGVKKLKISKGEKNGKCTKSAHVILVFCLECENKLVIVEFDAIFGKFILL